MLVVLPSAKRFKRGRVLGKEVIGAAQHLVHPAGIQRIEPPEALSYVTRLRGASLPQTEEAEPREHIWIFGPQGDSTFQMCFRRFELSVPPAMACNNRVGVAAG